MKILGCIIAHNEERTLPIAISIFKKLNIPYIAILDKPTLGVRWILRHALDTYEMPLCQEEHIYRWKQIVELTEWAIKRPRGFDWVWRIDADEVWDNIIPEIKEAHQKGFNIINYAIRNYRPLHTELPKDMNFRKGCILAEMDNSLYLAPRGMPYQRVWSLKGEWDTITRGGHIVQRQDAKVFESCHAFHHYPVIDQQNLKEKCNRKYLEEEKKRGWHWQYDSFKSIKPLSSSIPTSSIKPKIKIFYHVALINNSYGNWKDVIEEQLFCIRKSGILKEADLKVYYVTNTPQVKFKVKTKLRINPIYCGKLSEYEFPTLTLLWEYCKENPQDYILYMHTKGISKGHKHSVRWRKYLMWGCVEKWERCIKALSEGYEMAGVEWKEDITIKRFGVVNPVPEGFWAGNFFWARADYIKNLPNPYSLDTSIRYYAEAWSALCGRMPKVRCFHDTRRMFKGHHGWEIQSWDRKDYVNT